MTRDNVPSHYTPSFTAETSCTFHRQRLQIRATSGLSFDRPLTGRIPYTRLLLSKPNTRIVLRVIMLRVRWL